MTQTIPDFETLVVDRLQINNREIQAQGLKTVYRQSPIGAPDLGAFPLAYVLVGQMRSAVPAVSAGVVDITRDFIIDLPVAPLENTTDTAAKGADAITRTLPWFAIVRNYYINHPRLETDAGNLANQLQYIYGDLRFQDSGIVQLPVPGTTSYAGIRYTLTISMRARATRIG